MADAPISAPPSPSAGATVVQPAWPPGSVAWKLAIVGAGPAGLALAIDAARRLPKAELTLFDARAADVDVSGDPRTLALAQGSVVWLQRLQAWPAEHAQPIMQVHVSQAPPTWQLAGLPAALTLRAADEGLPQLGAVLSYGALVARLQRRWQTLQAADPLRLRSRLGQPVAAIKAVDSGVEVDAGIAERFDLAVVAEGGVFAGQARKPLHHDYAQQAWVGTATLDGAVPGLAVERFTREGPLALLPLLPGADGSARAALVWCVASADDPVAALTERQRIAVLNQRLPAGCGRIVAVAAEAVCVGFERRTQPGRRPHGAHRQCGADAASGRRPGAEPGPARRRRAGAGAAPRRA